MDRSDGFIALVFIIVLFSLVGMLWYDTVLSRDCRKKLLSEQPTLNASEISVICR